MTGIFVKRGTLETHRHIGRTPCEGKGRDWGDASMSQWTPDIARRHRTVFLTAFRRTVTQPWGGGSEKASWRTWQSRILRIEQQVARWRGWGEMSKWHSRQSGWPRQKRWDEKQLGSEMLVRCGAVLEAGSRKREIYHQDLASTGRGVHANT